MSLSRFQINHLQALIASGDGWAGRAQALNPGHVCLNRLTELRTAAVDAFDRAVLDGDLPRAKEVIAAYSDAALQAWNDLRCP
jgi:hypothetical protein